MDMNYTRIFICILCIFHSFLAWGQKSTSNESAKKATVVYSNQADAALTIHNLTRLPAIDNVDGIFAKPLDKKLQELISEDRQWNYVDSQFAGTFYTPTDLIQDSAKVTKLAKPLKVDGVLITEVRKNPKDFVLSLYLFSAKDGKLITRVSASDLDQSSTDKALVQLEALYKQLKARIPYDGLILSRTKNRVTMNLGSDDNVTVGQELSIAKIIQVTRHPKLGSILNHEKAIIGKIRVIKVDKSLSFGDILTETENGAIQTDTKIIGARPVAYTPENWINTDEVPAELLLSENNKVNGKIQEWRPELPPTFGQISASLGLANYSQNLSLSDGTSLSGSSHIYPSVNLEGEIWINPEWYIKAGLSQGTGSIDNPVPNGTPSKLSSTMSQYSLDFGYNLLLKDDFFDSKLFAGLGFYSFDMDLDKSAEGLPSTTYSGARLTLGGKTPVDNAKRWYVGASLMLYFNPNFKEKPITSGTSYDSKMVHFNGGVDYRYSERIWITGALDIKTMMSDISGNGTRLVDGTKQSQKMQTLLLGIGYMF